MQNIDLICVGKLNAKYFAEGVAEYQKRLAAFASFRIIELPEEKKLDKIKQLPVAPVFAEAIERIYLDKPVSPEAPSPRELARRKP